MSHENESNIYLNFYLNKHLLFEFFNFDELSRFYIEENFNEFSKKYKEDFEKPELLWNLFEHQNSIDISILDRSSTYLIQADIKEILK